MHIKVRDFPVLFEQATQINSAQESAIVRSLGSFSHYLISKCEISAESQWDFSSGFWIHVENVHPLYKVKSYCWYINDLLHGFGVTKAFHVQFNVDRCCRQKN